VTCVAASIRPPRPERQSRESADLLHDQASRLRHVACLMATSVTAKNQKPNLLPRKNQSASFLIWVLSGFYFLGMVWLLLSTLGKYGTYEPQPSLGSAVRLWNPHAVALA
jgi:hypothetical protein